MLIRALVFINALCLVSGLSFGGVPNSAAGLLSIQGEGPQTQLILRNPLLEVVLSPYQRPGMLDRLLNRATGEDFSALAFFPKGEGIATQRTNHGYLFWEARDADYRVVEDTADRAVVEVTYAWRSEKNQETLHFDLRAGYTLERSASRLEVHWQIINRSPEPRSIAPWLKNTARDRSGGGHFAVLPDGPGKVPSDHFMPNLTNWMAAVGAAQKQDQATFFTVVEHERVHEFYHWHGRVDQQPLFTHEVMYQPALLAPGEAWQSTYYLGLTGPLPNVVFASPEGAVSMTPLKAEAEAAIDVHFQIAGTADLGRVRLEGELLRDDVAIMPLGPRHVQWQPGKIEQAHYSLRLPEAGVYVLRLNVYDEASQQIALGEAVGATVRVIEVPLVVGDLPAGTPVATAWPKAPVVYQPILGRDRDLPRLGAVGGLQVAAGHPALRVFREDRLSEQGPVASAIERSAARGEWESISLLVFAGEHAETLPISLDVSPLKHVSSEARIENIHAYEVAHVLTSVPSRLRNLPVGRYPDPLLPLKGAVTVPAQENVNLWINVQVPTGIPAGRYEGHIRIMAGGERLEVPLHLNVWDFDLPYPASLRTWAGFVGWNVPRQMAWQGVEQYDLAAFREQLYRWCVDYGFAPGHGAVYDVATLTRLARLGRGVSTFFGGSRQAQAWATTENIQAHGWNDRVYQYAPFDEHLDAAVPDVARWSRAFREKNPLIKVLDVYYGNHTEPLFGLIDVWCRQIERAPWVQERQAAGDEFWGVNSRLIGEVEAEFLPGRQEYWQLFDHGYTGQLLWSVAPWGYEPPDYRGLGMNALAVVLYPTAEGPTTSIRWENMRDGLEDYDYLTVLRQRVVAAETREGVNVRLLQQARAIVDDPNLHQQLTDPAALESLRHRIAELIVAIGVK